MVERSLRMSDKQATFNEVHSGSMAYQTGDCLDWSAVHPTFADFLNVEKDHASLYTHRFAVFNDNNSQVIAKVVRPRGYTKVYG